MSQARAEKRNTFGIQLLTFGLAYIVSRLIFKLVGWDYNPFRDPFDALKLAIDVLAWIAVYFVIDKLVRWRFTR